MTEAFEASERRSDVAATTEAEVVRFGEFELDARLGLLRDGDHEVDLQRTPLRLLIHLARNRHRSVPKDELLDEVWGGAAVSDAAISSALKELRRVLRDDGAHQQVIQTRRGVGYRFVAKIATNGAARGESDSAETALDLRRGLAVIPLDELGATPEDSYFATGMTDALIDALSRIDSLRVISRTSMMRFRGTTRSPAEIARELRVDLIAAGSVLRVDDRVRIQVELLDAEREHVLWTACYEREAGDVLKLQREVAWAILREIRAELASQDCIRIAEVASVDPQCHDAYLMGQTAYREFEAPSVERSISCFRTAIECCPGYAPAHAGLAASYAASCTEFRMLSASEAEPLVRGAVDRALELDPQLPAAHAVNGSLQANFHWRFAAAERAFRRALELRAGSASSHMGLAMTLAAQGDAEAAIDEAYVAVDLDPLNMPLRLRYARMLWCGRRFDDALREQSRVIAIDPTRERAHWNRGTSLHHLGRHDEAIASWRCAVELTDVPKHVIREVFEAYERGGIDAYWKTWITHAEPLLAVFPIPANWMWVPYAALGDLDRAFEWLERDFDGRGAELAFLEVDPFFDPLRDDARFETLRDRMRSGVLPPDV